MIRGCLVFLGAEIAATAAGAVSAAASGAAAGAAAGRDAAAVSGADLPLLAAAMELFQGGLLAHDDIMDRDELRRGAPTIHARYAAEASARYAAEAGARYATDSADAGAAAVGADALHVGEALAICLGDFCYFAAFQALAKALPGNPRLGDIIGLCGAVLREVAVAQMTDVAWGAGSGEIPEERILEMYRGKTAHYSFSLPLAVGAMSASGSAMAAARAGPASSASEAGDTARLADSLYELGEKLGILFQIRDDELGLFGSSESIGKVAGSDLREGKKTLFRSRLLAAAPASERARLLEIFGGGFEAEAADIGYVRRLSEDLGVARSIAEMSRASEAAAAAIIAALPRLEPGSRAVLEGLVEYVSRRDK